MDDDDDEDDDEDDDGDDMMMMMSAMIALPGLGPALAWHLFGCFPFYSGCALPS